MTDIPLTRRQTLFLVAIIMSPCIVGAAIGIGGIAFVAIGFLMQLFV